MAMRSSSSGSESVLPLLMVLSSGQALRGGTGADFSGEQTANPGCVAAPST
jgi:hypothetical protein